MMNSIKIITTFLTLFFFCSVLAKNNVIFSNTTIPYVEKSDFKIRSVKSYNNLLTKKLSKLKCPKKNKFSEKSFWDNYTSVQYNKKGIISVRIRSNYNCDGTFPVVDLDNSITFDLNNGRVISIFDVFPAKDKNLKYIRTVLAKGVDEKCSEKLDFYIQSEKLLKENLIFYLSKAGVKLKLKTPLGISSCVKEKVIKWDDYYSNIKKSTLIDQVQSVKK